MQDQEKNVKVPRENELTREEIIHCFHLYHQSKVIALHSGNTADNHFTGKIDAVMNHLISVKGAVDQYRSGLMWPVEDCKLLLTPLPAITVEHAVEVAKIEGMPANAEVLKIIRYNKHIEIEYRWVNENHKLNIEDGYSYSAIGFSTINPDSVYTFQYLIQQGYAVPLFFGIDHWANGKTAIELHIAIEIKNHNV